MNFFFLFIFGKRNYLVPIPEESDILVWPLLNFKIAYLKSSFMQK